MSGRFDMLGASNAGDVYGVFSSVSDAGKGLLNALLPGAGDLAQTATHAAAGEIVKGLSPEERAEVEAAQGREQQRKVVATQLKAQRQAKVEEQKRAIDKAEATSRNWMIAAVVGGVVALLAAILFRGRRQ